MNIVIIEYRLNDKVVDLVLKYTDRFGALPIYFEDIKPFLVYFETGICDIIKRLESKVDFKVLFFENND